MRDFKFDMDVILRNCERFGVKVEIDQHAHGVTMNGKPFDVTEEMHKVFEELSSYPNITTNSAISNQETVIQNLQTSSLKVTLGTERKAIQEQFNFSSQNAPLNAA